MRRGRPSVKHDPVRQRELLDLCRSAPRVYVSDLAALQRTFIDSVAAQKAMIDRMERLTKSPLAAVK